MAMTSYSPLKLWAAVYWESRLDSEAGRKWIWQLNSGMHRLVSKAEWTGSFSGWCQRRRAWPWSPLGFVDLYWYGVHGMKSLVGQFRVICLFAPHSRCHLLLTAPPIWYTRLSSDFGLHRSKEEQESFYTPAVGINSKHWVLLQLEAATLCENTSLKSDRAKKPNHLNRIICVLTQTRVECTEVYRMATIWESENLTLDWKEILKQSKLPKKPINQQQTQLKTSKVDNSDTENILKTPSLSGCVGTASWPRAKSGGVPGLLLGNGCTHSAVFFKHYPS